ncbi:LPXTG cell wall anchor domain-containing protein [Actinomadura sp. NAK00032]|uniref:neocarzinostatin apoprotein domain-containing protein n=1 Tax=Actinomadura sp. NAK00032 TaxID=2742128 RepID=UPI00158FD051|nr:neocarzinostatin apoprotein domain-containing protein [Actinomadura sp. NAK00032]QKW35548.1 LPXTG cell wall anchor domain-containing protein [Actinomadura sp. NAK00032]
MIAIALAAALLSAPALPAAGAAPAPELQVSRSADLAEGATITVTQSGFRPGLKSVAVGLCREGYTNGLKDCVLAVTAPGNQGPNSAEIPLTFAAAGSGGNGGDGGHGGGGGTGGGSTPTGGGGDLPNTGSPDGVPTYALVASALVMAGGAALLIIPRRRKGHS